MCLLVTRLRRMQWIIITFVALGEVFSLILGAHHLWVAQDPSQEKKEITQRLPSLHQTFLSSVYILIMILRKFFNTVQLARKYPHQSVQKHSGELQNVRTIIIYCSLGRNSPWILSLHHICKNFFGINLYEQTGFNSKKYHFPFFMS